MSEEKTTALGNLEKAARLLQAEKNDMDSELWESTRLELVKELLQASIVMLRGRVSQ